MMVRPALLDALDALGGYAGPCDICGAADHRHRLYESIRSAASAHSPRELSYLYGVPVSVVLQVLAGPRYPARGKEPRALLRLRDRWLEEHSLSPAEEEVEE
jgi:hypothetical protein